MFQRGLLLFASFITVANSVAFGHGFSLSLSGGSSLQANSENPASDLNPLLFVESFHEILGVLQGDDGWAGGGTVFASGKHFSFDLTGPLWYSNGGTATPAALGVKLTLTDQQSGFSGQTLDRTGLNSGLTSGFPISGKTNHEMIWELTLDTSVPGHVSSIPDGMYGIAFSIKGGANGGSDFTPTPWLVTAKSTPGFDPDPDLNPNPNVDSGARAIYAATVPEPSTLALAALGMLCGWSARKRLPARRS